MSDDKPKVEAEATYVNERGESYGATDWEMFTAVLRTLNIPYHVQPDNTVVLTFRRIRFDMDGKRAKE